MRQFFQIVVPLLLPTVLYAGYLLLLRSRGGKGAPEVPWMWLGGAGVLLLGVTFLAIALLGGAAPSAIYVPPKVVDGRIEPGHYEPAP
ncbi:MAG TPA: DUF6111 family protein [Dongiaceae bacterium]|nr:DUF6111 family protein [Dongiaceae bacterium]